MDYSVKKIPEAKLEITAELSPEEFEKHRESALDELRKYVKMEGFRQGNVPREIAQQQLGDEAVLTETARKAIEATYLEIIDKDRLDVVGEPEVQITKMAPGNPFAFQITIGTIPDVQLPDYKQLAKEVERKEVAVEDQEVDGALQYLRESRKAEDGTMPELTDEFAKELGHFQTMQEVRDSVKEGLMQEKQTQESQRVRQELLEKIASNVSLEVPDVLVEREKRSMLENIKNSVPQMLNMQFDEYLQKVQKTEQELLDSLQDDAARRVRNSLVLREITKAESIEPSEEEVEQEATAFLRQYQDAEKAKQEIDPARLRQYIRGVLENEKTFAFLEGFVQKQV